LSASLRPDPQFRVVTPSKRRTAMFTMLPEPELLELRKRVTELSTMARENLTAHVRSADELSELGLMLGLLEVDPTGMLVTACPWELDGGPDAAVNDPDRRSDSTSE
jgi:hypothetical protein